MNFFNPKKPTSEDKKISTGDKIDLQILNKINQEFAISLDLNDTLNTTLK